MPVKVPALRKRVEDIGLLVNAFLNEFSQSINVEEKEFSEEAIGILKKYNWPGNVRELKNLVERLVIMTQDRVIQAKHIPSPFNRSSDTRGDLDSVFKITGLKEAKNQFEKAFLEGKLKEYGGNISQTAEAIGIERSNLHKKIKAYGLNDFRP